MTREEAIHFANCLKKNYTINFNDMEEFCDMVIKALEQEPVIDKIRAEIIMYEGDCRLSVDEYPSCKQCTDNVFETIYTILDKYKGEIKGT